MPIADYTTQFDDEVLPAGYGTGNLGYSGNGRQIAKAPDGRFIVGFSHAIAAPVFTGGRTPAGGGDGGRECTAVRSAPW